MRGGIGEGPVVVLSVDLHEGRPDGAQHLHADRLVVDEGPGASVRHLRATQDQVALGVDLGLGRDQARGMIERRVERCGDAALALAMAHEPSVAPPAQREREGVEEDRLARARLPSQDAQPLAEIQLKLVDQNDVADRKLHEHAASVAPSN
ncbi:hypothetical protein AEGHOMDF_5939 [Methylobacterium soli]|nr:hypothetical protein AEGHOMDF_5939 [Methylobacterium soli]